MILEKRCAVMENASVTNFGVMGTQIALTNLTKLTAQVRSLLHHAVLQNSNATFLCWTLNAFPSHGSAISMMIAVMEVMSLIVSDSFWMFSYLAVWICLLS